MRLILRECIFSTFFTEHKLHFTFKRIEIPFLVSELWKLLISFQGVEEHKDIVFSLRDVLELARSRGISVRDAYNALEYSCNVIGFPFKEEEDIYYLLKPVDFIDQSAKVELEFISEDRRVVYDTNYRFEISLFCLPIVISNANNYIYANRYLLMDGEPCTCHIKLVLPSTVQLLEIKYGDDVCYLLLNSRESMNTILEIELLDKDIRSVIAISGTRFIKEYLLTYEEVVNLRARLFKKYTRSGNPVHDLASLLLLSYVRGFRKNELEISEYARAETLDT